MSSWTADLRIMEDAAVKAGRSLARDFGEVENLQLSAKGPRDFVTSADMRAEKTIISHLQRNRPDYHILSEEAGAIEGAPSCPYRFIIDPLDGTTNFMHGVPFFAVSIGLEMRGDDGTAEIVAGIIFAPALQEIYSAQKNGGAFLNGRKKLRVSARTPKQHMLYSSYFSHGEDRAAEEYMHKNADGTMRIFGSAALEMAFIAAGKLDATWNHHLKPWDMAAGITIIREAGGIVTDKSGSAPASDIFANGSMIAGNEHCYKYAMKLRNAATSHGDE